MTEWAKAGFRYLYDKGVVYKDPHHAHANTGTIVGHVTLATGAHAAAHGMVGNVWFDHAEGRLVYNIEDARYKLLSADADVSKDAEIDPTQKTAKVSGRSPANIMVSTLSDERAIHTAGRPKIFGVSIKDRSVRLPQRGLQGIQEGRWWSLSCTVTRSLVQGSVMPGEVEAPGFRGARAPLETCAE